MKSKKSYSHLGSHALQIVKWTAMSFACLMTFSLGIFLGKRFSDSNKQPAEHALIELSSEPPKPNTRVEQQQSKGTELESKNHALENNRLPTSGSPTQSTTKMTTSSQTEQPSNSSESQETQDAKDSDPSDKTINKSSKNLSSHLENDRDKNLLKQLVLTRSQSEMQNQELDSEKPDQKENFFDLPQRVKETLSAKYTIQLGVYDQEKQAIAYVKQLRDQGIDAFYMSFNREGKSWYRVSSGVYSDKALATNEINRILRTTSVRKAMVQEIL